MAYTQPARQYALPSSAFYSLKKTLNSEKINRHNIFFAASSGLLLTLACPKSGLFWLAWCALVPLLWALRNISPRNGFYLGFCSGLTHYLTLVYWLVPAIKNYGHLPLYLSLVVLFLLAAYLALYLAVFSTTVIRLGSTPVLFLVLIPCLWVALEYLRSLLFTGFPWELLGHTQYQILPLVQLSDILGVYGVSFGIALGNAAICLGVLSLRDKGWQSFTVSPRQAFGSLLAAAAIVGLAWFYGTWRIHTIDDLAADARRTKVSIVQGNIDQAIKWNPAFQQASTLKYIKLSLKAQPQKPDLIVWPETATPFYFLANPGLSGLVLQGVQASGADFLIGSPSVRGGPQGAEYYNSAYLINPQGNNVYGRYDKTHLVPFGEYVPLKQWLPFIHKIAFGAGDFRPGKKGDTIPWGKYRLGIQICYEIIFPELARAMVQNNAALLVNITNDAWYGRSSAPYQHFSMAIFRAVENRRSLIRAANTGISGFIDPVGRITAATGLFEDALLTRSVPVLRITTRYTQFGDLFAIGCLVVILTVAIYTFLRKSTIIRARKTLI